MQTPNLSVSGIANEAIGGFMKRLTFCPTVNSHMFYLSEEDRENV